MAHRTAIAARISPYPRSVVPQTNDGAPDSRKAKRAAKRREAQAGRPGPRPVEEPRFNVGPRRTAGPASSTRRTRRANVPGRDMSGSLSADEDIPDYPPPSFQEAMQESQAQSSSSHLQAPTCAQVDQSLSMSTQSFHSAAERRVESPPIDSPLSGNASNDSLQILDEAGRSHTPEMYTCRCGSTRRLDDSDLRREVSVEHTVRNVSPQPAYPTPVSPAPTKKSHAWLAPLRTLLPSRLNSCRDVLSPTSASAPVTPSQPSVRNHFLDSASMPTPRTPTVASISTRTTPLSPTSAQSFRKRIFNKNKDPSIPPSLAPSDESEDSDWTMIDRDETFIEAPNGQAAPRASIESCPPGSIASMQVMQPQVVRRPNPPRIRTDFSMAPAQTPTPVQVTPTPAAYETPGLTMGTTPATPTPAQLATPTTATYMTAATSVTPAYDLNAHYTGRPLPLLPRRLQRKAVDSTFAPADEAYWRNERANGGRVPEGVLIDLDDQ
ncbi:hypothetical protein GGG16DRAFT_85985 [Schizophyllum commune]